MRSANGPGVHAVTRCYSCPFYQSEWSVCQLVQTPKPFHGRKVPHPENMGPPPEWCPLRAGGILVVLDVKTTP